MIPTLHTLADWARWYSQWDWALVPIAAGTKRPRGSWTTDQVRRRPLPALLAALRPGDGLGVVQGPHSCAALDIDGTAAWHALQQRFPRVPWHRLPQVLTGSGGRHLYFAWPAAWTPLAARGVARVALWSAPPGRHEEISVHVSRSVTVLPPSQHPNGTRYRWIRWPAGSLPAITDPAFLQAVVAAAAPPALVPPRRRAPTAGPDRLLAWLARRGITPTGQRHARDRLVLFIPCPWAAAHSTPDDGTATAVFWSPQGVGFRCLHAHCRHRTWRDLAALPRSAPGTGLRPTRALFRDQPAAGPPSRLLSPRACPVGRGS